MPFDPNLPVNQAKVVAAELRGQFNGLRDLIEAVPAVTGAVVDSVTTVNPSANAAATVSFDGANVRFTFSIPRGQDGQPGFQGMQGNTGLAGNDGAVGPQGIQGPPFTNFLVEAVNTLEPGQQATVTTTFDGAAIRFTFSIPRGSDGLPGMQGTQGNPGAPGPQDLSGTSNNSNGVTALNLAVSDPPTQGEIQSIANKLDELIAALRRV